MRLGGELDGGVAGEEKGKVSTAGMGEGGGEGGEGADAGEGLERGHEEEEEVRRDHLHERLQLVGAVEELLKVPLLEGLRVEPRERARGRHQEVSEGLVLEPERVVGGGGLSVEGEAELPAEVEPLEGVGGPSAVLGGPATHEGAPGEVLWARVDEQQQGGVLAHPGRGAEGQVVVGAVDGALDVDEGEEAAHAVCEGAVGPVRVVAVAVALLECSGVRDEGLVVVGVAAVEARPVERGAEDPVAVEAQAVDAAHGGGPEGVHEGAGEGLHAAAMKGKGSESSWGFDLQDITDISDLASLTYKGKMFLDP